jgi:hypothetical protein
MVDESAITHGPYILAESFHKANIQDRLWYVMTDEDLDTLMEEQKIAFGDRAYVITTGRYYICGNDATWYTMGGK